MRYLIVFGLLSGQEAPLTVECQLIEDDAERLACYDSKSGHKPATAAVPSTVTPTRDVVPTAEDFGLTEEQRNRKKPVPVPAIDEIESRIAAIERLPRDKYVLTLENGQKWMQTEPTTFPKFHVGDAITIRMAALGSFLARGPSSEASFRVRRID